MMLVGRVGRTGLWIGAVLLCACGAVGVAAQTMSAGGVPRSTVAASRDPLDINKATAAELKALPGMGVVYVQRVIAGRPYTAKNQLTTRGILPADAYAKIKDLIIAHRVK
jgi:competence protein ComEA